MGRKTQTDKRTKRQDRHGDKTDIGDKETQTDMGTKRRAEMGTERHRHGDRETQTRGPRDTDRHGDQETHGTKRHRHTLGHSSRDRKIQLHTLSNLSMRQIWRQRDTATGQDAGPGQITFPSYLPDLFEDLDPILRI